MINTKIAKESRAVVARAQYALDASIQTNRRIENLANNKTIAAQYHQDLEAERQRTKDLTEKLTKPLYRYAKNTSGIYGSPKAQAVVASQVACERLEWRITSIAERIKTGTDSEVIDLTDLELVLETATSAYAKVIAGEQVRIKKRDTRKEELLKKRLELAEQPIHLYAKKTPYGYRFLTDDLRKGIQKRTGNISFPSLVEGVTENGKCIEGNCFDIRKLRRWLVLHKGIVALVKVHTPTEQEGQRFGNVAPQIRFVIQRTMNSMLAQTSTFVLKAETGIVHSVRLG